VREAERETSVVEKLLDVEERAARGGVMGNLWEWTKSVLVAFALFLVIRTVVIEAFRIPTSSMENTLLVGDFLFVNKAVYGAEVPGTSMRLPAFAEPERGDVIVFNPPHEPEKNYVKRLVGMPLDTLEMRGKRLYLNGSPAYEPYVRYTDRRGDAVHPAMRWQSEHLIAAPPDQYHPTRDNWGPIIVPAGSYFVLGDNRDNSEDSRYWGFVSRDQIRGRPWFVYYSFQPADLAPASWLERIRWGRIGEPIR